MIVLSVIVTIGCLRAADRSSVSDRESGSSRAVKWENCAAFLYALSISYKIYPIIYAPAIWVSLRQRHGWIGRGVWRFGIVTAVALVLINGILWSTYVSNFRSLETSLAHCIHS